MKQFTYQVLRYRPDMVSGEFINVGLVLFNKEEKFIKTKTIEKIGRVKHLFPQVDSKSFIKKLKSIQDVINRKSNKWLTELDLNPIENLASYLNKILPRDDSSIFFTAPNKGIDLSPQIAFDDLYQRMILAGSPRDDIYSSDHKVWRKFI